MGILIPPVLAIHSRAGSFSDRWIESCARQGIPCKVVDCYRSDIIEHLASVDGLLWHFSHGSHQDLLIARHVIRSAEQMGLLVFPSTSTCWHFDDKLAEKYLLEAVGAPLIPTHVFYSLEEALQWIDQTSFPKVFRLRRGAGSRNVMLVHTPAQARRLVQKAFGREFKPVGSVYTDFSTRVAKNRRQRDVLGGLRRLPKSIAIVLRSNYLMGREKGYVYFQDFIPGNLYDIRITVVGDRAFGFTRDVCKGDFWASGSGLLVYDRSRINLACVRMAFDVSRKIGSQNAAFDILIDPDGQP